MCAAHTAISGVPTLVVVRAVVLVSVLLASTSVFSSKRQLKAERDTAFFCPVNGVPDVAQGSVCIMVPHHAAPRESIGAGLLHGGTCKMSSKKFEECILQGDAAAATIQASLECRKASQHLRLGIIADISNIMSAMRPPAIVNSTS